MFFKPNTFESSNIRNILLNPSTNQVIVQFKNNAKTYLYDNVNEEAIIDVFFGEITSFGKFVNAYCKCHKPTVIAG
jgi:hypothetical protein